MHGITRTRNRDNVEQSKLKAASTLYANKCNQIYSKNVDELSLNDLSDIGEVLSISPENSTLWNLRKRIILRYLNELQQSKSDDLKNDSDQDEERLNIFKNELRFNAVCLSQNPKSYASWFHRKWCLQAMDNATLLEEMDICKEYLSRDERNFHCWAYWYFLTNEINLLTPEQCLAFVTEKLIENFSNYSAWHYRSMLLANNSSLLQFSSAVERELLHNAFFTDPDDQSAWFYHRWILKLTSSHIIPVCVRDNIEPQDDQRTIHVSFSQPIDLTTDIIESNAIKYSRLLNESVGQAVANIIWTFQLDKASTKLELNGKQLKPMTIELDKSRQYLSAWPSLSDAKLQEDKDELNLLTKLKEMEPMGKWVNLAYVTLLYRLNPDLDILRTHIFKLIDIDPLRKQYYKDLLSSMTMRDTIRRNSIELLNTKECSIQIKDQLTRLYYLQYFYFVKRFDFSECKDLRSLSGIELCQCLEVLDVSNNQISIPPIEILQCNNLKQCILTGNPLSHDAINKFKNICNKRRIDIIF